jgi:hypothetical protein
MFSSFSDLYFLQTVWLFLSLFVLVVYSSLSNLSAIRWLSPLLLMSYNGGLFTYQTYWTLVYTVSFIRTVPSSHSRIRTRDIRIIRPDPYVTLAKTHTLCYSQQTKTHRWYIKGYTRCPGRVNLASFSFCDFKVLFVFHDR